MSSLPEMGRLLILAGVVLLVLGLVLLYRDRIPLLGHLPGDIIVERDSFRFYFPVTTCLLLSLVLSLVVYLVRSWF